MRNNPNLDLFNINAYEKNKIKLVKSHQFTLKLLSANEILTSIKGHNSERNLRKLTCNNPNIDLVNINAYPNCDQIPSICSKDIERKRNSDKISWIIKGHISVTI